MTDTTTLSLPGHEECSARALRPIDCPGHSAASLAYLAGIVDGEGYIGINHRATGKYRWGGITIEVAMTNEIAPRLLQHFFGGSVFTKQDKRDGGYRKQAWRWSVVNVRAAYALRLLEPYLRVKAEQAKVCFAYRDLGLGASTGLTPELEAGREALWLKIKALNQQNRPH